MPLTLAGALAMYPVQLVAKRTDTLAPLDRTNNDGHFSRPTVNRQVGPGLAEAGQKANRPPFASPQPTLICHGYRQIQRQRSKYRMMPQKIKSPVPDGGVQIQFGLAALMLEPNNLTIP